MDGPGGQISRESVSPFSVDTDHLIALRDALHRAALAVRALDEDRSFDVETKGDNTPLTSADLAANEILRSTLPAIDPEAGWLSEENEDRPETRLDQERLWIVDPIDGTREFVDGSGEYSISAGLAINGRPDLGGVALPGENLIAVGARGLGLRVWRYDAAGAFKAESAGLRSRPDGEGPRLQTARILVSKSESKRGAYADVADELQLAAEGSIARKMALVAIGRADLVVSLYPKSEWDLCGGAALLLCQPEAGLIELEHGAPQRFNRRELKSIGLAGGAADLVREFAAFRKQRGLPLRYSYD